MHIMKQLKKIKNNVLHIFKFIYEIDKKTFYSLTVAVILSGVVALPALFFPKLIINEFVSGRDYQKLIRYAVLYAGITLALNVSYQFIISKLEKQTKTLEYEGVIRLFKKVADIDYYMLQNADTMDNFAKATKCVMAQNFYLLNTSLVKFFSSIWLLVVVTGTLILLDPKILLIVGAVIVINAFTNSKMNKLRYKTDNELWPLDRRMTWFMRFAGDLKYAKDVRSNNAQNFLFSKYRKLSEDFYRLQNRLVDSDRNVKVINFVLTSIQEFLIYLILGFNIIIKNTFTVGDFSVVFNAMNTFKSGCSGIIDGIIEISNRGEYFKQYLDFINITGTFRTGEQKRYLPAQKDDFVIEFKDVSYRYPNQEKDALHCINVTIRSNEKISIVGENGAGKTTFIKLLLRFYDPTEGAIYLNGVDIRNIDYDDYCGIFSTVFQDFNLFSLTLRENLTLGNEEITDEDIKTAARKIGFLHFIDSAPKQLDTLLFSDYDKEGIDLSGGESQKLAIMRALLRQSHVIILDEPTAALDPQAEYNIYKMIDENVGNKLMVYISHRLSSCRFCDKILLFADGVIAEEGTHKSLMEVESIYRKLFHLQAQYYIDEEEKQNETFCFHKRKEVTGYEKTAKETD